MKLNQNEKQFITDCYNNGESPDEIAINVGISVNAVKRALADTNTITLSWYKTKQQHALLEHLKRYGILSVSDFEAKVKKS